MTIDNLIGKAKLTKISKPLYLPRHLAIKRAQELKKKHISKAEMAKKMHTSRSSLDRLLDPTNTGITLKSLVKLAHVLGKKISFSFAA